MVAQTVFSGVCVIGMRRSERGAQLIVVRRVLILVTDNKSDWTSGGHSVHQAREYLDGIALLTCCCHSRLSRLAAVEFALHRFNIYLYSGWHTVNHATYGSPVTLAKSCKTKYMSECIQFPSIIKMVFIIYRRQYPPLSHRKTL